MNTTTLPQSPVGNQSAAFRFGMDDARNGAPFAPECLFARRSDKIQYAIGFEMVRGISEITCQFTHSVKFA